MAKIKSERSILFTIPAIILYASFMLGPLTAMFYISTLKWTYIIAPPSFLGLDNYRNMFESDAFWTSLKNTIILVATLLPVMIPLAFMVGYYLSLKPRGHRILRVLMFTPGLISISATAMVFFAVLTPPGLLNGTLNNLGFDNENTAWLGSTRTALASIWFINLWQGIGYTAVLITARLESVPREIIEAAKLDGASNWNRMWRIYWPIILDYIGTVTMLQFLWTIFGGAGLIIILTGGGPGYATTTLGVLVYGKAFEENQLGYSQAAGVALFLFGLVGMILIKRLIKAKE
jgi:multiple sugar transport system permease protein